MAVALHFVKITPEERKTAVAAAKIVGLGVAGVDLLRSDRGPLVMEVNSSLNVLKVSRKQQVKISLA